MGKFLIFEKSSEMVWTAVFTAHLSLKDPSYSFVMGLK